MWDLLDFVTVFFLEQDLSLKMDLGERKVIVSVYKRTRKAKTQSNKAMIMGRGGLALEGFIVPEVEGAKLIGERLMVK